MKNKDFETAVENLQDLFAGLNKRGALTAIEIEAFNNAQRSIVAYYNYLEGTSKAVLPWTDERFVAKWEQWKLYRKQEHGFRFKSPISEQSQLTRLTRLANGNMEKAIELIQYSIENTWQGIFPIKESTKPSASKPKTSNVYKSNIAQRLLQQQ